jgi:2-hydroxychromene-2-carboxylate isomerase
MKQVEFFFDVSSPAAYLAYTQLPRIASERGAQIVWRPMFLAGVFKATGNVSPVAIPAKRRWILGDFDLWARHYGVRFELNPGFPVNTLTLMRGAVGLQMRAPDKFLHYVDVIFRSMWEHPRNLNVPEEVQAVLREGGFDPDEIAALAADAEVKERLKQNSDEAVACGVFGAPTFIVNGQLFFGQDRLHFVAAALDASAAQPIDRKSP